MVFILHVLCIITSDIAYSKQGRIYELFGRGGGWGGGGWAGILQVGRFRALEKASPWDFSYCNQRKISGEGA